jgi:hypothetical protein
MIIKPTLEHNFTVLGSGRLLCSNGPHCQYVNVNFNEVSVNTVSQLSLYRVWKWHKLPMIVTGVMLLQVSGPPLS